MNLFGETLSQVVSEPKKQEEQQTHWIYMGMNFQIFIMLLALIVCLFWGIDYFIHESKQRKIYVNLVLNEEKLHLLNQVLSDLDDIKEAQQAINKLAWVKSVQIRKEVNNNWIITLKESLPLAKLEGEGYIFADGSVMRGNFPSIESLPRVVGPIKELVNLAPVMYDISNQLILYDIAVDQFRVEKGGGLVLNLEDNKLLHLGSRDHIRRLARLLQFMTIYKDEFAKVQTIDLRYDNAVAVTWSAS